MKKTNKQKLVLDTQKIKVLTDEETLGEVAGGAPCQSSDAMSCGAVYTADCDTAACVKSPTVYGGASRYRC